jgi:hypothetical protein
VALTELRRTLKILAFGVLTAPTDSFGVRQRRIAVDAEIPCFAILWSTSSVSDGAAAVPLTRAEVSKVLVVAPMVIPIWGSSKRASC